MILHGDHVDAAPSIAPTDRMDELLARLPGARRALFAAFHVGGCQSCAYQDDETLGCGGLLIQLARSGANIRVLFLSDGAAGIADPEERKRRSAIRRAESRAALGVMGLESSRTIDLELPVGRLHFPENPR